MISSLHSRFGYAIDPEAANVPDASPLTLQMKALFSQVILDCCAIDKDSTLDMMRSYSTWTDLLDKERMPTSSLDEYYLRRVVNGGTRYVNVLQPLYHICFH